MSTTSVTPSMAAVLASELAGGLVRVAEKQAAEDIKVPDRDQVTGDGLLSRAGKARFFAESRKEANPDTLVRQFVNSCTYLIWCDISIRAIASTPMPL